MKQLLMATLLAIAIVSSLSALANGSAASLDASKTLSVGVGSIVVGSASLVAASGQIVVESVENTADGVLMVLHGVGAGVSEAVSYTHLDVYKRQHPPCAQITQNTVKLLPMQYDISQITARQ